VLIPTFRQMADPTLVPDKIRSKLSSVGLWDTDPVNLFRITWKNEPVVAGGGFGNVNSMEFPRELTGVDARIIALVGKWFPTGSHKVGATYGCLVPALVSGQFDPTIHTSAWPSTGNFCRGGAYTANLLGCESVAILPEGMSRERFDWLSRVTGEVITTPGGESNVKEVFDKCAELLRERSDIVIFNQFEQYGNHLWHYYVSGQAAAELVAAKMGEKGRLAAFVSQSGSAGTLGAGDYLKERYPLAKIVASEALQCPTLLMNGFGDHRIEGIGDKHVPWIHNVRNTDVVMAIDDQACLSLLRLFNEPEGRRYLETAGVASSTVDQLSLLRISGIGNLLSAVKLAKYFELDHSDVVVTVLTDSVEMYVTRLQEMNMECGPYGRSNASSDFDRYISGQSTDHILELDYPSRKRIHNLKYYTWIEQQGKDVDELNRQWNEFPDYWDNLHAGITEIDQQIDEFNERSGVLENL